MNVLLSENKAIIKSLIISWPHSGGISINELNEHYREKEGVDIPYKELGFKDLKSFLTSLKETVVINGSQVFAVASDKTKHIQKMVSKQKKRPRKRPVTKTPPVENKNQNKNEGSSKRDPFFIPNTYPSNIFQYEDQSVYRLDLELEIKHLEYQKSEVELEFEYIQFKKRVLDYKYQILSSKLRAFCV